MTAAPPEPVGRRRAPALWLVVVGLLVVCLVAALDGARGAAAALVTVLLAAAVARLLLRGRRPEGVAVRSTWVDVLVLGVLAVAIGVLMLSPSV